MSLVKGFLKMVYNALFSFVLHSFKSINGKLGLNFLFGALKRKHMSMFARRLKCLSG